MKDKYPKLKININNMELIKRRIKNLTISEYQNFGEKEELVKKIIDQYL